MKGPWIVLGAGWGTFIIVTLVLFSYGQVMVSEGNADDFSSLSDGGSGGGGGGSGDSYSVVIMDLEGDAVDIWFDDDDVEVTIDLRNAGSSFTGSVYLEIEGYYDDTLMDSGIWEVYGMNQSGYSDMYEVTLHYSNEASDNPERCNVHAWVYIDRGEGMVETDYEWTVCH